MRLWRSFASLAISMLLVLVTVLPAAAENRDRDDADYLALGDSVAFGFSPLLDPHNAANFVGYPERVGQLLDLRDTNASCPGEASGGFISLTGVDNVCRPYRAAFPLHVNYTTSQLDFAVAFLKSHPRTRLITIDIGANDLFVLEKSCTTPTGVDFVCVQKGLPKTLAMLGANLKTIYAGLANASPHHHKLVAVTYYALNYRDPVGTQIISAVNSVVAAQTLAARGRVADGFDAFGAIAAKQGGDSCKAGLLIVKAPGMCDIHPSPLGRDTLAAAVLAALGESDDQDVD